MTAKPDDLEKYALELGRGARQAAAALSTLSSGTKNAAITAAARAVRESAEILGIENEKDLAAGREKGLSKAVLDRLALTPERIEAMAAGLEDVARLADPVGEIMKGWRRPNGLLIEKVRVPLGVVLMIYESRPNVTADAAALLLKSGNACILRGGKEAFHSNLAIARVLQKAVKTEGLPERAVQLAETTGRALVGHLLKLSDYINLVIPRGGKGNLEPIFIPRFF